MRLDTEIKKHTISKFEHIKWLEKRNYMDHGVQQKALRLNKREEIK